MFSRSSVTSSLKTYFILMCVQKDDELEARRSRRRRFEDRNVGCCYMRTGKTSQRRDS
ncbi:hypothetical protein [Terrilactibacillus tamarindi]|uniref:hypothetical protein n=1 Tax=Terrilactibacillus tamarindi TaxID=2599694 RepID=UPI001E33B017|nr:hypothetical protein [Terrilactibacillus tamarindi]